jgi:putative ABC transport system permease protein
VADLKLTVRNLLRNRRRSLIALGTLVFGVVALLLAGGFIEWIFWAMRESTIESRLGHIQVVRAGYFQAGAADPFNHLLTDGTTEEVAIRQTPHVKAFAPRLQLAGLVSFGDNTVSFLGEGVDPEAEKEISKQLHVNSGMDLAAADPNGVILGTGLARNLGAAVGDRIVLLTTTASGGINAIEVTIRGLFFTSTKAFDDTVLRLPIGTAQQLLRTTGAHTWVLLLDETNQTSSVLSGLRSRFPTDKTGLEFVPWFELADFYNKTVRLFSRQILVVQLIIAVIIVLTISNIAVMNVLERTAEIGTLMAVGFRRSRILRLFLAEGVILGVIGGTIGTLVGWALSLVISAIGIPMPPPPGMDVAFDAEILVTSSLAANGFLLALAAATLATVYPAWKASRLQIVDALRRSR